MEVVRLVVFHSNFWDEIYILPLETMMIQRNLTGRTCFLNLRVKQCEVSEKLLVNRNIGLKIRSTMYISLRVLAEEVLQVVSRTILICDVSLSD